MQQFHMDQSQSTSIMKIIKMAPIRCNKVDHQCEAIKALCLRAECNMPTTLCFICCMKFHYDCSDSIKLLKDIPLLVLPIKMVLSKLKYYKMSIKAQDHSLQFADTIKSIEQFLDYPNISNLDKIGAILKIGEQFSIQKQIGIIEEEILTQQIQTSLSIDTLDNQVYDRQKQETKEDASQSIDLQKNEKNEKLLIKNGVFDPNNQNDWQNKGASLHQLNRFREAIDCYNQALLIDPNNPVVWNRKGTISNTQQGQILYNLGMIDEARYCSDTVIYIQATNYDSAENGKGLNKVIDCNDVDQLENLLKHPYI